MRFFTRILPILVIIPAGIYFAFVFRRFLKLFPAFAPDGNMKVLGWVLSFAFGAAFVFCTRSIWSTGVVVTLYFLLACLALQLVHIFWKNPYFYGLTWVIAGVFTAAVLIAGYVNMHTVHEKYYSFTSEKVARDVGIAFISDLHLGVNMDADGLREHLNSIGEKAPDMLILGGDIFDESTDAAEMEKACVYFGEVKTRYGVFYVGGNHDSNRYSEDTGYSSTRMTECLEAAGVKILRNGSVGLDCGITLTGLNDKSKRADDIVMSLKLDTSRYNIILDHQPVELAQKAEAGADLNLSGHTHGGQIWPLGIFNEYWSPNDYNYGERRFGDMTSIVSSGIAGWGYPIRTENSCEYLMISINKYDQGE